jgi:Cysteine-rich CPXCG
VPVLALGIVSLKFAKNGDSFQVTCPYCGETVELFLEFDVEGRLVQDCEVCCNPWQVQVWTEGGHRRVSVGRADGSE